MSETISETVPEARSENASATPTLSDAEMEKLKTLARLELSTAETEAVKHDLNKILESFESLRALDTETVEELVRPVSSANMFRDDVPRAGLEHEEAVALGVEEEGFLRCHALSKVRFVSVKSFRAQNVR